MAVQFPGQKPDEAVKVLVRPHWLVLLRPVVAISFLAVIPIVALIVLSVNGTEPLSGVGLSITAVIVPAYYLTLITWFFIAWVDYYLDVGIITDRRIIDMNQRGMFQRNVAELDCRMVQDINADKTGILETIFDFGNVIVQTAAEHPNFIFHAVPHPDEMVEQIREAVMGIRDRDQGSSWPGEPPTEPPDIQHSDRPSGPVDQSRTSNETAAPGNTAAASPIEDLPRQYER